MTAAPPESRGRRAAPRAPSQGRWLRQSPGSRAPPLLAQADGADIVRGIRDGLEVEFGHGEFLIGKRQRQFRGNAGIELDHKVLGGAVIVESLLDRKSVV